jgi:hypothetical protein
MAEKLTPEERQAVYYTLDQIRREQPEAWERYVAAALELAIPPSVRHLVTEIQKAERST